MFPLIPLLVAMISVGSISAGEGRVRDLSWFLRQMRSLDRLPGLEASHTAMSSTWDRTGANADGSDFKRIENDGRNILLDVDGPGCVHRIFVGTLRAEQAGTRIQIYLDGAEAPIFDFPIPEFFDDQHGPIPYPLVFFKSYPGTLFPIPYSKHCRIQLVNPGYGKPDWNPRGWGDYWQVVYTTYPEGTDVKSLTWPPSETEQAEIEKTSRVWLKAESNPPAFSEKPSVDRTWSLKGGKTGTIRLEDCGIIRRMRVLVDPPTPESLLGLRLRISYDGAAWPSVDVPAGYFFGNAYAGGGREATSIAAVPGRRPTKRAAYHTDFFSLLMGSRGPEAYTCFPMPFARGAVLEFVNESAVTLPRVRVRLEVEKPDHLPADWGRFHATWSEHRAATGAVPKFGPLNVPGNVVLDRRGRGKYVGVMLHIDWPDESWWGEGDWPIWTDEDAWPPSYHGTGSEEYFNSGWCQFDRKAVSGFVTLRPGHPMVYSFHLNDAFQFERSIRVVEEQMGGGPEAVRRISEEHPVWGATAFWYALPARPAESKAGPPWIGQLLSKLLKKP